MPSTTPTLQSIPTNIITGFLGAGKTSLILNLMKSKPSDEKWAILVNEFGEIGIDGAILSGHSSEHSKSVFIREVPGGCMCCAAGLPMQIALTQLLKEARPDRLLIEPTGLGHPKEVLQVLTSDHYRQVLSIEKTLTLVDARNLHDKRYTEHDTFNQQIAIADTIVGTKLDLYDSADKAILTTYIEDHASQEASTPSMNATAKRIIFSDVSTINQHELEGATHYIVKPPHSHSHHSAHHHSTKPLASEISIPDSGLLKASNKGEGFYSVGWRFSPNKVFNKQQLLTLFLNLNVERLKAVFITYDGIFSYNMTKDGLEERELDDILESRIEVISTSTQESLENELLSCLEFEY
ncbi:GTP-binding protein [Vibrio sp.]|nr:GTP-binding protein [Vibrio sp.]